MACPLASVPVTMTVRKEVMVERSGAVTGGGVDVGEEEGEGESLDGSAGVVEEDDSGSVVVEEEEGGGVVAVVVVVVVVVLEVVDEVVEDELSVVELELEVVGAAEQTEETAPAAVEREMDVIVDSSSVVEPCMTKHSSAGAPKASHAPRRWPKPTGRINWVVSKTVTVLQTSDSVPLTPAPVAQAVVSTGTELWTVVGAPCECGFSERSALLRPLHWLEERLTVMVAVSTLVKVKVSVTASPVRVWHTSEAIRVERERERALGADVAGSARGGRKNCC